jgi:fermentation-respiration switch protein FrsA (DUF1100 family)
LPLLPRLLRLVAFALLVALLAYLAIYAFLAWTFVSAYTNPGCHPNPAPIAGLPLPEEIFLRTSDGLTLRVWYYPSQNGAALLALGGITGSLGNQLPPVAFLIQRGYGVLQIDSRACAKPPAPVTLGGKEAEDAATGLAFLQTRPEVHHIGVIGFSMGGVTAIRAAARHPAIAAVVAEGGFFNLGDDFVEPNMPKPPTRAVFLYTIAGFFWLRSGGNPWEISPIDDLPDISPRPLLLIYGEHEAGSGRAQAQFAAARQPKTLWIVPGGSHGGNYQIAPEEYERRVIEFFNSILLPP